MDKEILELLKEMQKDIKDLKTGQDRLENRQSKLEEGQQRLELGQSKLEEGQQRLELRQSKLEEGQERLEIRQSKLEEGQQKIMILLEELEPKNANRHLELKESIKELRKDLTNVEIITSSNWNDIAKLKSIK